MSRLSRYGAGALAFGFIVLHLPYLPASLEDLDSINFALGVRHFDVTQHQPHPPGYPVFILAAKILHLFLPSEAQVLSLLGVLCGGIAAVALVVIFSALDEIDAPGSTQPLFAALLALTSPLFFMTAARPLSDVTGLAAALGVQALIFRAKTSRDVIRAGALSAFFTGIRSQVAWLTLPLLLSAIVRQPRSERWRTAGRVAVGYVIGVAIWAVPLVILTGGPATYVRTVFNQGAEDLSGVVMLWTTPTPRQLVRALQAAFVAPWSFLPTAVVVLVLAAAGSFVMVRRARPALLTLAVAFGPYLVFDLLFQETVTTRYALPLVIPIAYAAVRGASLASRWVAMPAMVAIAGFNVFVTTNALAGYSQVEAPAFRLLHDMRAVASTDDARPVLAMHRRDELDFRRPIFWVGDRMPALDRRLASPPKHEWLEVVKYWNGGGRQPVWFVADPPRSDLALVRRQGGPTEYRWPFNLPLVVGGARPNEMDWYILRPPDWYLGEGWAITPETAGVAREDGRGPGKGGSQGWVRRWPLAATLMVGGRNLADAGPPAHVRIAVDGRVIDEPMVPPGFFLRMLPLPANDATVSGDYATVTVTADQDQVAIEQFDAQPTGRFMFGYGEGWNEQEYNPTTGLLWRWTTEKATLRVRAEHRGLVLSLAGEIEEASTSRVTIRVGDQIVAEQNVGRRFRLSADIPPELVRGEEAAITIETSAWYIPAEKRWRSRDRRHLGLKIYSCEFFPAS